MLVADFIHRDMFHDSITDFDIEMAIQLVESTYSGIKTLWGPRFGYTLAEHEEKVRACMNWLVAWQLAVLHPTKVLGTVSSAGMPLISKKIENIELKFQSIANQEGALKLLETSIYGEQALAMIQTAPEMYTMFQ